MTKIVVLGAGLVGKHVAADLASKYEVTAVDRREEALHSLAGTGVEVACADLSGPEEIKRAVEPFDLVVGALPGAMGTMALRAVIEAGRDVVDIAFSPEDPFDLDDLAKARGVTAVVDMGVAPGTSNAIMGHHARHLARVDSFECLVGGLPVERSWPFDYKAPFSPSDVIEEYVRPARFVENGSIVVRPALSDVELVEIEGVGLLEAFNTDGLRTLARTFDVPNMKEKTLRYPGHADLMRALRDAGFFASEPIDVGGRPIRPLDFTSKILFPSWELGPEEEEFTVVRIVIAGEEGDGRKRTFRWSLVDRYDRENGITSMARTTGYSCTAAVNLVADGRFTRRGICPPEYIGAEDDCFEFLLAHQRARGIDYRCDESSG